MGWTRLLDSQQSHDTPTHSLCLTLLTSLHGHFPLCTSLIAVLRLCVYSVVRAVNVFRDPRWGRGQETPGEDTYLTSQYAFHFIQGMQRGDSQYLTVSASCKHFAGYDLENWGGHDRSSYNALINPQDLVETYLPPFLACMKDAAAASVMCAYNAINGVPSCANSFLLNTVARQTWGWDGYVVSDCQALSNLYDTFHYVATHSEQVKVAMQSGVDLGCDTAFSQYGEQAVRDGNITVADVDRAFTRLSMSWLRMGYFDPSAQQPYMQYGWDHVNTTAHRALAKQAALESITLLKNSGGVLPLSPTLTTSANFTIALIGPHTDNSAAQVGVYAGEACGVSTPYTELVRRGVRVIRVRGCDINSTDTSNFTAALAAAQQASLVLYVGGIDSSIEKESVDRSSLALPSIQLQLIQALEKVGKTLVVVLMSGGGVDVSYLRDSPHTSALLWMGYPSQAGGDALVDVLLGLYSPAGRLPVTWYPAVYAAQVAMTDQSMRPSTTSPGRTYKFYTGAPVFAFGFGLSYSRFSYSAVLPVPATYSTQQLSASARLSSLTADISLTINVTNVGTVASSVSVLAFLSTVSLSDPSVPVSPPLKELFDYTRLPSLSPGQSQIVLFGLNYRILAHVDADGHQWLLPGTYRIAIQQEEELVTHFELLGKAELLEPFPTPHTVSAESAGKEEVLMS